MPAFPEPKPDAPRILQLTKSPEDMRLATAVLCYGESDVAQLASFTKTPENAVRERLASQPFKAYLAHLKEHPEEVLPAKAHIIARLVVEMNSGDRSTDRQRAAETLMEMNGQKGKGGVLDKFRKKEKGA